MNKKLRSWIIFVIIVGIILRLVSSEDIRFEFKGFDIITDSDRVEQLSGLDTLEGDLYITPIDSWKYFEQSVPQTTSSLYAQTYDFTEKRVKKIFRELLDRGVKIKLIMENHKYRQYQDTFTQISQYFSGYDNFEIQSDAKMGTNYTHSKIMLLDHEFLVQTANLTHSSFFKNREYFFVGTHTGVRKSLQTIFEKDWRGEQILLEDIHPNVLVCDINCRVVIEELLSSAEKSIIIETQYISDSMIKNILGKQLSAGLDIKIVLADTDDNQEFLKDFGPQVARALTSTYNHSKMMLIDGETLLIGSMNMSTNSLDKNREIGILTKDEDVIQKFLRQFWVDWG